MATAKDIVAHMVAGKLICTTCSANMLVPEDGEVTRWDIEREDVCSMCGKAVHAESSIYVVGNNLAGYMPDSEPYVVVGTFDDAKRSLIDTLKFEEDYASNEEDAEAYSEAAEDVNLWSSPDTVYVSGRAYWITLQ